MPPTTVVVPCFVRPSCISSLSTEYSIYAVFVCNGEDTRCVIPIAIASYSSSCLFSFVIVMRLGTILIISFFVALLFPVTAFFT